MNKHFDKNQCRQKGIFPPQRDPARGGTTLLVGIIIIAIAIVAVGGVLAWQYSVQKPAPVVTKTCVGEGESYGAPKTSADLCCAGLVRQPTSQSGTSGICVKPTSQTAGWKTYTNTQYGFEIKYPDSFLSEEPFATSINCSNLNLTACPYIDRGGLIVKSDSAHFSDFVRQGFVAKTQNVAIDGNPFCFKEMINPGAGSGDIYDYYLTTKNQQCFSFSLHTTYSDPYDSVSASKHDDVLNQIISTFKFTTPVDQTASQQLSDAAIIAALNKLNKFQLTKNAQGNYSTDYLGGTYNVNMTAKGDLNGDNLQDAVVFSSGCGASCGSIFTVVINKNGGSTDTFNVVPDGIILSSAMQSSIKSITIDNGVVSMSVVNYQANGSANSTFTYKLIGKNLVKF